jgi:hypothetical protein
LWQQSATSEQRDCTAVFAELRSPRAIRHNSGIATITSELDEDFGILLLSASDSADALFPGLLDELVAARGRRR